MQNKNKSITVASAQLTGLPPKLNIEIRNEKDRYILDKILNNDDSIINRIEEFYYNRVKNILIKCAEKKVELVVFPELTFTSFFPYFKLNKGNISKLFSKDPYRFDNLIRLCKKYSISICIGYPELHNNKYYNTAIFINYKGESFKYRKTHIPGFKIKNKKKKSFQFELEYFEPSTEGYPSFNIEISPNKTIKIGMLICHDRRYNNPFITFGFKKTELILIGYNTPFELNFAEELNPYTYKFHYIPLQSQAISEGTFIINCSRAGNIFGINQIAGSSIINPYGEILQKTEELKEEILIQKLDLGQCDSARSQKYFNERSNPEVLYRELKKILNIKS